MAGDLFVKDQAKEGLEAFVGRMAALFGVASVVRRDSGNYIGDEYYVAEVLSLAITFARTDEMDLEGYEFWIHIRPTGLWVPDHSFTDSLADVLARRLTIAGESVVRLPNAEFAGGRKVFYRLRSGARQASKEQIITTER
jgi:hypothetical protein